MVIDPVTRDGGSVKLNGEVWSARPLDDDDVLEAGTRVQVIQIKGATAIVSE
jgi:membrane protein implicated in regulation of membrane protease activity